MARHLPKRSQGRFSKLERRATPDGFVLKQMMRLNMTVMRQDQVLTVSVKTHLNRDYTLKSFDLRMDNPARSIRRRWACRRHPRERGINHGGIRSERKSLDKAPMVGRGSDPC